MLSPGRGYRLRSKHGIPRRNPGCGPAPRTPLANGPARGVGCAHERRRRSHPRGHHAGRHGRHHERGLLRQPVAPAGAMPETPLTTPSGEVAAYLAVPAGEPPFPGVVVLHEAFGLNADIRRHAERFAGRGYLALAPDLFSFARPKARCVLAAFRALSKRSGPAFEAIEAARNALAERSDATGR